MISFNGFKNRIFSLMAFLMLAFFALQAPAAKADYQATIVVSPSDSDPVNNGVLLLDGLNQILLGTVTPSQSSPFLIKLEPGVYDVGSFSVQLPPFVELEGSGEGITLVRGDAQDALSADQGVIVVRSNSAVRQLSVENYVDDGDFEDSAALLLLGAAKVSDVTAISSGSSPISRALMTGFSEESGRPYAINVTAVAKTRAVQTFSSGLDAENLTASGVDALFVSSGEVSLRNSRLNGSDLGLLTTFLSEGVSLVTTEISGDVFCTPKTCRCLFSYTESLKPTLPNCLSKGPYKLK